MKKILLMSGAILTLTAVPCALAWTISAVGKYSYSGVEGLSGITWAGGNQFYLANDSGGVMQPAAIGINLSSGAVTSMVFGTSVSLSGRSDIEGIAYNPSRQSVFVSDETGPSVTEYYPYGLSLGGLSLPSVFSRIRSNKSLESCSMSGDGLTLWTANEEALTCDGGISTTSDGTTVRLTKFTRPDLNTTTWTCAGQWAYKTDKFVGGDTVTVLFISKKIDSTCHGVSDLCALPDGTLLVLERDCSVISFSIGNISGSDLINVKIYAVAPSEFSSAKNIVGFSALTNATYTAVSKGSALFNETTGLGNFEGMCLGPRLSDGSTSLLLVSDGDESTVSGETITWEKKLYALKLSGGSIMSLDSSSSAHGVTYPPCGPYRYMNGADVQVGVTVPETTYSNVYTCTGCTLGGGMSATGETNPFTFSISGDHTTCRWNWNVQTFTDLPVKESFESYSLNQTMNNVFGWTGDGIIAADSYSPPSVGFPIPDVAHTKVLNVDNVSTREINGEAKQNMHVDSMVYVSYSEELGALSGDEQTCLSVNSNGFICIYALMYDASAQTWTPRWVQLSEYVVDSTWIRVGIVYDNMTSASTSGDTFFQVRVNGSICTSEEGWRTPNTADLKHPGSWFMCLKSPGRVANGNGCISRLQVRGSGKLDDLVVSAASTPFTETANPSTTYTNGIPLSWFDSHGIGRNPAADLDADQLTAAQEYITGTDPLDQESTFRITDIRTEGTNVYVSFLGSYNAANNDLSTPFIMERTASLTGTWESVDGNVARAVYPDVTNVWHGTVGGNDISYFYRPRAVAQ